MAEISDSLSSEADGKQPRSPSILVILTGLATGFLAVLIAIATAVIFLANRLFWDTHDGGELPTVVWVFVGFLTCSALTLTLSSILWFYHRKPSACLLLCIGLFCFIASYPVTYLLF